MAPSLQLWHLQFLSRQPARLAHVHEQLPVCPGLTVLMAVSEEGQQIGRLMFCCLLMVAAHVMH